MTRAMRRILDDPILCDLVLIRGHYGVSALHGALQEIEQPVAALIGSVERELVSDKSTKLRT
jgi:hypothetical protein